MADIADISDERSEVLKNADIEQIRRRAQYIQPGDPGECVKCGEYMPRLINGVCCRCRDKLRLP